MCVSIKAFEVPVRRCSCGAAGYVCRLFYFGPNDLPELYAPNEQGVNLEHDIAPPEVSGGTLIATAGKPQGRCWELGPAGEDEDDGETLYQIGGLAEGVCSKWRTELKRLFDHGYRYVSFRADPAVATPTE